MSTNNKSRTPSVDDMTNCPICFEKFVNPKILPCNHSFCEGCVRKMKKGHRIECPMDRKVFELRSVRCDFRQAQFMEVIADLQDRAENPKYLKIHFQSDTSIFVKPNHRNII